MLFNSYIFLLAFFPAVFAGYRLLEKYCPFIYAKLFLVLASVYFYGFFKPSYVVILVVSIIINYLLCCKMWESNVTAIRRLMLVAGCVLNIGILGYFKYTGMTLESMREQFRPQAENQVKCRLALEKIAELENILPTDEEIEAEYEAIATAYNMEADKVKEIVAHDAIVADMKVKKAMEAVKANAVIVDAPEKEEAEA